ncbi:MAG: NAD(P)/FAD-dependent oxidoreductase, partial [Nocardioidaceae bacterium]
MRTPTRSHRAGEPGDAVPDYRSLSLWHDTAADDWVPRDPLRGDLRADVAVVGAGLTGLWTAYYLLRADPSLRVVVLEAETAGFGASGRSGGLLRAGGSPADGDLHERLRDSVDEVGRIAALEGIDARFQRTGLLTLARSRAQLRSAHDAAAADARTRLLSADQARSVLAATRVHAATYRPDCAVVDPARLVRGLAEVVASSAGGRIYEHTPVTSLKPHRVQTPRGTVTADLVVRALEGYTPDLPGHRRQLARVQSLFLATEPLPEPVWEEIGLREREAFTDYAHVSAQGVRTADDRLVYGGRCIPHRPGAGSGPSVEADRQAFAGVWASLRATLPRLRGVTVTHAWGGLIGVAPGGGPSVGLDPAVGLAWAGGYADNGLAATNLAGRTLRDLLLGRSTALTCLPWVTHDRSAWPPGPLRSAGVHTALWLMAVADREERLTGRPSRLPAGLGDRSR